MGLTAQGYVRRDFETILADKIKKAKELFGEDIDVSDQEPLGKYIRINAYDQALAEEEIEAVYYARFPNTASGQSLDRLCTFGGITRNPATAATYSVQVTGTAGHVIEVGFLVGTDSGLTYYTTGEATIGEGGTCLVAVECTEAGSIGNVIAGTINRVVNPDANVSAVMGVERMASGADEESDAELRTRLKTAMAGSGSGNENAILAAVLRVPTVQYAAMVANNTSETDSDGRPPHSFEVYVLGGDDYEQEIAQAIFAKRAVGIQTVGDNSVTIIDVSGNERVVNYSSAVEVMVTARIQIKTNVNFPDDGVEQVQSAVNSYINSNGIGNKLVTTTIYGHIYQIPGIAEVTTLELSTDGGTSYSTANIEVPKYGLTQCEAVNVEVTA